MQRAIALAAVFVLFLCSIARSQTEALYKRVEQSVVKVSTTDSKSSATGFVWGAANTVVTALHVVDGSNNILVNYPTAKVTRPATVQRVLKNADLVLLVVANPPPDTPVLTHNTRTVTTDDDLHTLGFPLDAAAVSSFMFKSRYGGRRLSDNISSAVVQRIRTNGYPDPNLDVLKLGQESLLPGLSGAPIFNAQGEVVAIGDGGLEEGAINISWGIPAEHLNELRTSTTVALPKGARVRELFAADLDIEVGKSVEANGASLIKLRTRTLKDLASSADDQLGLAQLATLFSMFDPTSFRYDIYQDKSTGATIVLPEGSVVRPGATDWSVALPPSAQGASKIDVKLVLKRVQPAALQNASVQFEESLKNPPTLIWSPDPQWSYLVPISRYDGLVVNRKAAYGVQATVLGLLPQKYLFETLAARGDTLLGLAVINNDSTYQTTQQEMLCGQGLRSPICQSLIEARRTWAQLVLGIQMTSFGH
jgi:hypothetical protein